MPSEHSTSDGLPGAAANAADQACADASVDTRSVGTRSAEAEFGGSLAASATDLLASLYDKASTHSRRLEELVRTHPGKTLALAALVGWVAARTFKR